MKLLIVGSRSIKRFDLSGYIPCEASMIISGGALGIDSVAEKYADDHKMSKLIIRPRYDLYGKAAPLIRNKEMVDLADEILVIWDGKSRGAMYTVKYAKQKKQKYYPYKYIGKYELILSKKGRNIITCDLFIIFF